MNLNIRLIPRQYLPKGAVQAAKFLKGKTAGYYDMSDVITGTVIKKISPGRFLSEAECEKGSKRMDT